MIKIWYRLALKDRPMRERVRTFLPAPQETPMPDGDPCVRFACSVLHRGASMGMCTSTGRFGFAEAKDGDHRGMIGRLRAERTNLIARSTCCTTVLDKFRRKTKRGKAQAAHLSIAHIANHDKNAMNSEAARACWVGDGGRLDAEKWTKTQTAHIHPDSRRIRWKT